jgi:hypothetical protein
VFIRNTISDLFKRYVYEDIPFNGIAELLEILGSLSFLFVLVVVM